MKPIHYAYVGITLLMAIGAIEAWYRHPTYGQGLKALAAATQAAMALE
ncbi:MAG: hypothetical protein M3Y72_20715 [Acidobacteriota bacterium]|nr:hypothetical protein [Acidobacteriota bacterium]